MSLKNIVQFVLISIIPCLFFACGGDHSGHGHSHKPMFGGVLVELGDHAHNLEILHDKEAGKLDLYILGGHAAKVIKIAQASISVNVETPGGETALIEVPAQANELTNETVGDTSHFSVTHNSLKTTGALKGTVQKIEAQGAVYEQVAFNLNTDHDHSH